MNWTRIAEASPSSHELTTLRLQLLRQLAGSLEVAQAEMETTTPAKLDHYTAQQQQLCWKLLVLANQIPEEVQAQTASRLADDVQEAARRVGDLNREYAALLRRRQRTVDIFCRVLASSGTTYPAPKPPSLPDLGRDQAEGRKHVQSLWGDGDRHRGAGGRTRRP